jgi:hypothetical protein
VTSRQDPHANTPLTVADESYGVAALQRRDGVVGGQAPPQVTLDELLGELQSDIISSCSRCRAIGGELCGKVRGESFQLRSCPFRECLRHHWPDGTPITLRPGVQTAGKVVGVTFDDRHLLEGVGQHSGRQHASYATAKNHCLPAPIHFLGPFTKLIKTGAGPLEQVRGPAR